MIESKTLPPPVRGKWIPMSVEEFDAWAPYGVQAEWVDGEGIIFVTNTARHALACGFLSTLLRLFVNLTGAAIVLEAPFQARLPGVGSRREPDILVVLSEHRDRIQHHWLEGPPDLAFEFVSEHTARIDLVDKRDEFARAGIPEYVAIETRDSRDGVIYLRLDSDRTYQDVEPDKQGRLHSAVLPGFWIDPSWFRRDPLPSPVDVMLELAPEAFLRQVQARYEALRRESE
jgi:Uma2 family endonuclease